MIGVAIAISVAIMLGMLYLGMYLATEWESERRITGFCTILWVAVGLYLFLFQWLWVPEHELTGLFAITTLSTAGYVFGRSLAFLTRREYPLRQ